MIQLLPSCRMKILRVVSATTKIGSGDIELDLYLASTVIRCERLSNNAPRQVAQAAWSTCRGKRILVEGGRRGSESCPLSKRRSGTSLMARDMFRRQFVSAQCDLARVENGDMCIRTTRARPITFCTCSAILSAYYMGVVEQRCSDRYVFSTVH